MKEMITQNKKENRTVERIRGGIRETYICRVEDKKYIEEILFELKNDLYNKKLSGEKLKELAEKFADSAVFLVVQENKKESVIGYVAVYCNDKEYNRAFISMIIVKKSWQSRGMGTMLLKAAIKAAKEMGMQKISLEVAKENKVAVYFYRKHGFSQVKENEYSSFMEKEII